MAVSLIVTDTWLSHLEFTGGRRQTEFGPIDGLFYGVLSVAGDSGGGNVTLNGLVSFDRKEDWVYIMKKASMTRADVLAGDQGFMVVSTGPVIPTGTTVTNPSFHVAGELSTVTNNAVDVFQRNVGGETPFNELPVFGDKRISGTLALIAAGFETNTDAVIYQLSIYGWLIRYSSFFRNLGGSFG